MTMAEHKGASSATDVPVESNSSLQGLWDIKQRRTDATARTKGDNQHKDPTRDRSDETHAESAFQPSDPTSIKEVHRCPSWDFVVTDQEVERIEREFGLLPNTLADLASMVREMSRVAPQEIDLDHKVKVVVEPTAGASQSGMSPTRMTVLPWTPLREMVWTLTLTLVSLHGNRRRLSDSWCAFSRLPESSALRLKWSLVKVRPGIAT